MSQKNNSELVHQPSTEDTSALSIDTVHIDGVSVENTQDAVDAVEKLAAGSSLLINGESYTVEDSEGDYVKVKSAEGKIIEIPKNRLAASLRADRAINIELAKDDKGESKKTPEALGMRETAESARESIRNHFEGYQNMRVSKQKELLTTMFPEYAATVEDADITITIAKILEKFGIRTPKKTKVEEPEEDIEEPKNEDSKDKPKEKDDKEESTQKPKDTGLPENLTQKAEQIDIDPAISIGTFVRPLHDDTIFEIAKTFEENGEPMVTIRAFDDGKRDLAQQTHEAIQMSVADLESNYRIYGNQNTERGGRNLLLNELRQDFLDKAKDSFKDKDSIDKFRFEFARMIKGEKMETGLSAEARESLETLNSYLNKLIGSAEREWKNKGKSPEEIKALSERYKSMFMSGIQLESEYDNLYEQKTKNSETAVGKFLGKMRDKWNNIPTKYKIGAAVAGAATLGALTGGIGTAVLAGSIPILGIGGSSLATKKAGRTWGAWAGVGITQALRGLATGGVATPLVLGAALARTTLETVHETSDARKTLKAVHNQIKQIHTALKDPNLSEKDRIQLEQNLATYRQQLVATKENFDTQAGQFDRDMRSAEERYNRGEIKPKEYLAILEKHKMRDQVMETIKKGIALATIGVAIGAGLESGGTGVEDTGNTDVPETAPVETESAVNPHEVAASSRGSIETIRQLQEQYTSAGEELPKSLQGTPEELAQRYDFWNPEDINESSVIQKGEMYGVNENGELYQKHLDGHIEIISNADGAEVDGGYDGKYFDYSAPHADGAESTPFGPGDENIEGIGPKDSSPFKPSDEKIQGIGPKDMDSTPFGPADEARESAGRFEPGKVLNMNGTNLDYAGVDGTMFNQTVEQIAGATQEQTRDNLMGQMFEKTGNDRWALPGSKLHYSLTAGPADGYSLADSPAGIPDYDPSYNLATQDAADWFNKMNNNTITADQMSQVFGVSNDVAKGLFENMRQIQMLALNLGVDIKTEGIPMSTVINQISEKITTAEPLAAAA